MIVYIMGLPRTGSSFLARMLDELLYVSMGDNFLAADSANPDGYYEDTDFLNLNKRLLEAAGGGWQKLPNRKMVRHVYYTDDKLRGEMQALLARKNTQPLWGWKDPRNTAAIWAWYELLKDYNTKYIITDRKTETIYHSLYTKRGMGDWLSVIRSYRSHCRTFRKLTAGSTELLTFNFDDFVQPEKTTAHVKKLTSFFRIKRDTEAITQTIQSWIRRS